MSFKQTGGLRGDPNDPDFAKNILPEFLEPAFNQAGKMANKKMDEIIAKDKQEDEEAAAFNKKSKQKPGPDANKKWKGMEFNGEWRR